MLKIRKAKKKHICIICNKEIKAKEKYMQISKKQLDDTYINGAICENCAEKIIASFIEEE